METILVVIFGIVAVTAIVVFLQDRLECRMAEMERRLTRLENAGFEEGAGI